MRIVIAAAYGMGNLGDEAIFETIASDILRISPDCRITAMVFDPRLFRQAHGDFIERHRIEVCASYLRQRSDLFDLRKIREFMSSLVALVRCDRFCLGGGGLVRNKSENLRHYLFPLFIAQLFGKAILILCVGVDKIDDARVIRLLGRIKEPELFAVRDGYSRTNLLEVARFGDVKVIPDPVFHFFDEDGAFLEEIKMPTDPQQPEIVGLNLSFWKAEYGHTDKVDAFLGSLATALNGLRHERPFALMHLPTVRSKDGRLFASLKDRLDKEIGILEPACTTIHGYLEDLAKCKVFLGMRMHSLILASNLRMNIIGIAYDEKVRQLKNVLRDDLLEIGEVEENPSLLKDRLRRGLDRQTTANDIWSDVRHRSLAIRESYESLIKHL